MELKLSIAYRSVQEVKVGRHYNKVQYDEIQWYLLMTWYDM